MDFIKRLKVEADKHPYPLLFATVSGAHLYGFPSPDSDFDLRGAHVLPVDEVLGLNELRETITISEVHEDDIEVDLVTHDVKKFLLLMMKKNGYVLEQLYSPLVVQTSPEHEELKALAHKCITRHHSHHYLGFAQTQWRLFSKEEPRRVKPLLYVFRVLLTGIYLMRTGIIEANLLNLNEEFKLPYLADLIEFKKTGPEKGALAVDDYSFFDEEYLGLLHLLEQARTESSLPDHHTVKDDLNDLLVRIRKNYTPEPIRG